MENHTQKAKSIFFIYLCIFFVSVLYRFYDLDKRGYFPRSDAPVYAGVIKTYRAAIDCIIKGKILKQDIGSINEYLYENGGQFATLAKDGLIPIGLIGSVIFGDNANTMLYTSAVFGVLTVILLFYILSKITNLFLSFIITLLLAVSPYHIGFSREGLTVTFSSFLLLAGIYLYTRFLQSNNIRQLYFCGLTLGFGFLCHYNIAPFIFVFFAYEICYSFLKRNSIKRILSLFIFTLLPLFVIDIFTRLVKLYGIMQHIKMIEKYSPYFNMLHRQFLDVNSGCTDIYESTFYYFKNLLYHEGLISSILLIISLLFILRRGIKADSGVGYFLISVFLLPFFYFFKLQHTITDRAMLSFIPLCYFIIGYGLKDLNKHKIIFTSAVIIAIFSNGARSIDYFNYRSNFEQVVNYMKQHKGVKHVSSVWPISRLYAGRKNVVNHAEAPYSDKLTPLRKIIYQINPVSVEKLKFLYNSGYNYLLLNIPPSVSNELTESAMNIQPEYSSDVMICNDRGDGYDYALLRDKKGKYLYRFNVYDLGRVLDRITEKR